MASVVTLGEEKAYCTVTFRILLIPGKHPEKPRLQRFAVTMLRCLFIFYYAMTHMVDKVDKEQTLLDSHLPIPEQGVGNVVQTGQF